MKNLFKKALSLLLVLAVSISVCVGLVGCNDTNKLTPEQIEQILSERRDTVECYMREQCTVLWKASEDVNYSIDGGKVTFAIKEGEYYLGLPYSYGGNTLDSFLDYCSERDEKSVPILSGVNEENFGNFGTNIGNDCSSAVCLAWGTINASIKDGSENTKYMCVDNGYIRVGEYTSNSADVEGTQSVCKSNGQEKMFNAYTQLKKGDAIIRRMGSGHVRMVVSIEVKRNSDGSINPFLSKVICLEQTRSFHGNATYFDEELNAEVNVIGGVDVAYTFQALFQDGYLPITCKELRDASELPQESISDSVKNASINDLFSGEITSKYMITKVKVEITNSNGEVVQSLVKPAKRYSYYKFNMEDFVTTEENFMKGKIDISSLEAGQYGCKVTVYTVTDKTFTTRNFTFQK